MRVRKLVPTSRREARTPRAPIIQEALRRHSPRERACVAATHHRRAVLRSEWRVESEDPGGEIRLEVVGAKERDHLAAREPLNGAAKVGFLPF